MFMASSPAMSLVPRRTLLVGGALSALGALGACSSSGDASTDATAAASSDQAAATVPTQMEEGMGSGAADGVFPRTVVHYQGESTINAAPTNIVVIGTGQADALLTLGSCPIGAAMPSGAEDPIAQYLKDAHPDQAGAIATITSVGSRTSPDTEAIGNLRPDLIATNASGKDDADTLYQSLTQIAPTVSMHGTGQYWRADFLLLADALGKREEAQRMLDAFTAEAAQRGPYWTGRRPSPCCAAVRTSSASSAPCPSSAPWSRTWAWPARRRSSSPTVFPRTSPRKPSTRPTATASRAGIPPA